MGHLQEKYKREYFLGGQSVCGQEYGVDGFSDFRRGSISRKYRTFVKLFDLRGKSVLDIGCGRGELLQLCSLRGCQRIVGVDFSEDAIAIAQEFTKGVAPIELKLCEASQMRWEEEFDCIFLLDVIEHIPDTEMQYIYPQLYKALKPSGFLIINTPIFYPWENIDETDYLPEVLGMHCNKQTRQKLRSDLKKWNFKHIVGLKVWQRKTAPIDWIALKVRVRYWADLTRLEASAARWGNRLRHPLTSSRNFARRLQKGIRYARSR